MYYKYETHMHTSEGSRCSNSTAAEMTRKYKSEGYSGIFITDHFFNGNSTVSDELPWKERIERYCLGYEHALEEGRKIGIDVFFGVEFGNGRADFLTYGIDKEWLIAHPEIMRYSVDNPTDNSIEEYIALIRSAGGMVIQAHPFREAGYINHFTLVPAVDGVEIVNASHSDPKYNERAKWYAESFGLAPTAGSDSHNTTDRFFRGGVALDHKISSPADYIKAVKERKISLFLPDERVNL